MVLKLIKRESTTDKDGKTGCTKVIKEFYEGKTIVVKDEFVILNEDINTMLLTEYDECEITGDKIELSVIEAYIMNNDGKTIERIR